MTSTASSMPSWVRLARTRSETARCGSCRWSRWSASERESAAPTPSDLRGRDLCRALTEAADTWLASLLPDVAGVALVAVGGYGRGELCPGSDLDVMLVHSGRRPADEIAEIANRVWYPVWDARRGLDHSVRTVKEAISTAHGGLKTALGV